MPAKLKQGRLSPPSNGIRRIPCQKNTVHKYIQHVGRSSPKRATAAPAPVPCYEEDEMVVDGGSRRQRSVSPYPFLATEMALSNERKRKLGATGLRTSVEVATMERYSKQEREIQLCIEELNSRLVQKRAKLADIDSAEPKMLSYSHMLSPAGRRVLSEMDSLEMS